MENLCSQFSMTFLFVHFSSIFFLFFNVFFRFSQVFFAFFASVILNCFNLFTILFYFLNGLGLLDTAAMQRRNVSVCKRWGNLLFIECSAFSMHDTHTRLPHTLMPDTCESYFHGQSTLHLYLCNTNCRHRPYSHSMPIWIHVCICMHSTYIHTYI